MSSSARRSSRSTVARASHRLASIKASSVGVRPPNSPLRSLIPGIAISLRPQTAEDPDRVSGSYFLAGQRC